MEQETASPFDGWRLRIAGWYSRLRPTAWGYVFATFCSLIGMAIFLWEPQSGISSALSHLAFFVFGLVFLREAYVWLLPKLELPLVKLLIAAAGVMAAAAATGISRMAVNDATGQDPSHFGTTVALLVPLSFAPVLAALVTVSGFVIIPGTLLWGLLKALLTWSKPTDLDILLSVARMFGCIVVVVAAASLLTPSSFLFPSLRWLASHSAYLFDFQPNPACGPVESDRVLRLNDDLVIIARMTADGPQFVRRECSLLAESTPLRAPKASSEAKPLPAQK